MFGIGVPELIIILIIGLIVFGPGKLPEIGRGLGKTIREFRKVSSGIMEDESVAATQKRELPNKAAENIGDESKKAVDNVNTAEISPEVREKE